MSAAIRALAVAGAAGLALTAFRVKTTAVRLFTWTAVLYAALAPLIPVVHALAPGQITTTERIGRAMIRVALAGSAKRVLLNADINAAAAALLAA